MKNFQQIKALVAGLLLSCSVVPAVMAEDIEIYTTSAATTDGVKPNILFIIDGSSDMLASSFVRPAYVSSTTYTGDCNSSSVYFSTDTSVPVCSNQNDNYINLTALACDNALWKTQYKLDVNDDLLVDGNGDPTYETEVVSGSLISSGTYSDMIAHYAQSGAGGNAIYAWRAVSVTQQSHKDFTVECESDSGIHGETDASANKYIKDGTDKYTSTDDTHYLWQESSTQLTLYHANYINYLNDNSLAEKETSYFDQVREAIETMVDGNTQVNIGMMVLDQQSPGSVAPVSEGGGILYEVQDGQDPRGNFIPQMWALHAEGFSPLSEAYYEALLYFGGKSVDYGTGANPPLVGTATGTGGTDYITPIELSCQANYIVLASNGKATDDDITAARQAVLATGGFECGDSITADDPSDDNLNALASDSSTNDNCLDELAEWAANNDVAELDIDAHDGVQTIITHTVGFGYDDSTELDAEQTAGQQLLKDTADKGDGEFYSADSQEAIEAAFKDIIQKALEVDSTFSSPAVSVNAFNRSTHLDDLYFTLFKPANGNHWEGNLKKYKIEFEVDTNDRDGDGDTTETLPFIADINHSRAVNDDTGFFDEDAQSYWTTAVDGEDVSQGGAVSVFDTGRRVFTFTGEYTATDGVNEPTGSSGDLTLAANLMDPTNTRLHDTTGTDNADDLLGTANKDEYITGTPYNETLTNWAKGLDALSDFGNVDTYDDVRPQMGDPLHAEPALVQYGETTTTENGETVTVPDLTAFVATNDGYLHAFDIDSGTELFSFIPQELLSNLKIAMEDVGGDKLYGLDGSVVAWINDVNGDGTISGAGEHVYIYFGMRRGGNNIYAMNVTDTDNPELLWVIKGGDGDYTQLAQTWSTINVETVMDGNTEKTVLIFGGGYNTAQDAVDIVRTANTTGNAVYIADATTGERLWYAGSDDAANTTIANMSYSIPARIKPLDISGDGYIDRLYAADTGGQIFRFDINNANNADGASLATSITGARIVDIAVADSTADNRRFYYPPDVALIDGSDGKYHALVISSGYRAHPLNETIHDRIYMIKDRNTGLLSSYTSDLITEASLHNATANIAGGNGSSDTARSDELDDITGAEGWYINLDDEDEDTETWIGEKGLAEALIIEGVAIVTTYTPNLDTSSTSCVPSIGIGKVYFLDMLDATAAFPSSLDVRGDRHIELTRGGIPPTPNVIITEEGVPTLCIGTECSKAELGLGVRKTYWYEVN